MTQIIIIMLYMLNPFQCSCLENPRDGEAWWAAVYGVAQSRTQLKRLGSSINAHGIEEKIEYVKQRHRRYHNNPMF